ncbi:MAG: hypothetical protein V4560_15050 [Bacteroidota bacterium]
MTTDQLTQQAKKICDREKIYGFQREFFIAGFIQGYNEANTRIIELESTLAKLIKAGDNVVESALLIIETKGGPY